MTRDRRTVYFFLRLFWDCFSICCSFQIHGTVFAGAVYYYVKLCRRVHVLCRWKLWCFSWPQKLLVCPAAFG